jgi:hypothetical protein
VARPRKELDAEAVYKLARLGCTQAEIADVFNVGQATISRNYGSDYARAQGEFKTSLRRAQYLRAVKDKSDTMLVHLGKHWLGQGDRNGPTEPTDQPPATDADGNPTEP